MNDATTLWIIEDNEYFRNNLKKCINEFEDLECTGAFSNCEAALAALDNQPPPAILLIDIGLPGMNGIEGIRACKKGFEAIRAGASGYLLKTATLADIVEGCRKVAAGGASLNEDIARMVLNAMRSNGTVKKSAMKKQDDEVLTEREIEILQLLAEGHPAKRIGEMLGISINTVRYHNKNIYRRLQAQSQTKALYEARRRGLI